MEGGGVGCGLNEPAEGCGVWGYTFEGPVGSMPACSATFEVASVGGAVAAEALSDEAVSAAAGGAAGIGDVADAAADAAS